MSSIVSGMNQEKTNRWLLIGAAVLAVVAGALVFAALANFSDDDEGSTAGGVPEGANLTLVAKENIPAGATLSSDQFELREYDDATIVDSPVASLESVDGKVTSTRILKGNQISATYFSEGTDADELSKQLPFLFSKGFNAIGVESSMVQIVGGHVRPGDFIDVLSQVREKESADAKEEFQVTEYLFQDVEVLARTSTPVDGVVVLNADGSPKELTTDEQSIDRRAEEVEADDSADVIVLKLRPEETLRLMSTLGLGDLTFQLRAYGDHDIRDIPPIRVRVFE